jgi:hypothetical protein
MCTDKYQENKIEDTTLARTRQTARVQRQQTIQIDKTTRPQLDNVPWHTLPPFSILQNCTSKSSQCIQKDTSKYVKICLGPVK